MPPKVKKSINETPTQQPLDSFINSYVPDEFQVFDGSEAWEAWSKSDYGRYQPFAELIDNAIAAIMALVHILRQNSSHYGSIYVNMNFEKGMGSIEHIGGVTFPTNLSELARCLRYGGKKQTHLNEHGCGLNTSLAILDRKNAAWKIYIRPESSEQVYLLQAPYKNPMKLQTTSEWPGHSTEGKAASFIEFPITKDYFRDLYTIKNPKMESTDLLERIRCELSHLWMFHPAVKDGNIRIYLNDIHVVPFDFINQKNLEYVQTWTKKDPIKMSTGGEVHILQIQLKHSAKKIEGSTWFKFALSCNGVYFFKNGRFIEAVNADDSSKLYTKLIGSSPHNSHNGTLILVNMQGEQKQLPGTKPTKTHFQKNDPLFLEVVNIVSENIKKPEQGERVTEEKLLDKFKNELDLNKQRMPIPYPHYRSQLEYSFKMTDTIRTPPNDLVVDWDKHAPYQLYEAKTSPSVSPDILAQLLFNWIMACESPEIENRQVEPILLINATDDYKINDAHKEYLRVLGKKYGFRPKIQNFTGKVFPYE